MDIRLVASVAASIAGVSALSWCLVLFIARWTERREILDVPNERSSHARPVPRGGGFAVVLITLGGWLTWCFMSQVSARVTWGYFVGGLLIAAISWLDDLRSVTSRVRFFIHSLSAAVALALIGYWQVVNVPLLGEISFGWFGAAITFLWITGLTNAYNFMDGIDGIAGGQAVVAGLGWALLGWEMNQAATVIVGLLMAASSLGFLGHNWSPARIFMGDVGAAFIGYSVAVLPLITAADNLTAADNSRLPLAGIILVWAFVFDTTFTLFRRWRRGERIFSAHRSHLYQRLIAADYSHRFVTLLYIGLAVCGVALAYSWLVGFAASVVVAILLLLCFGLWLYVVLQENRCRARRRNAKSNMLGERA